MTSIKYNPNHILNDLEANNIDLETFSAKVKSMSGGVITQPMFEFIYETLVVNNYNMDVLIGSAENQEETETI